MNIDFSNQKKKKSNIEHGLKVAYGNAKRTGYNIRWFAILFLILSPIFYMIWVYIDSFFISKAKGIITYHAVTIYAKRDSTVYSKNINISDQVNKGQELILLKDPVLENEIFYLQKELDLISKKIKKNPKVALNNHKESIKEAEDNLNEISKIKKQYEGYLEKGHISLVSYSNIVNNYYIAKNNLQQQKINLNNAMFKNIDKKQSTPLHRIKSNLKQELFNKRSIEESLLITSPFQGQIVDVFIEEGQQILKGNPLYKITKIGKPEVFAFLDPKHIDKVIKNKSVSISLPNGESIKGKIKLEPQISTKLPNQLKKPFDDQVGLLKIAINIQENVDLKLPEGLPVEIYF